MPRNKLQHREECLRLAAEAVAKSRILNKDGTASIAISSGEPDFDDICELVRVCFDFQSDVPKPARNQVVSASLFELAREPNADDITPERLLDLIAKKEKAYRRQRKTPFFLHTQVSVDTSTHLPRRLKWENATIAFYRHAPRRAPTEEDYGRQLRGLGIHKRHDRWYYVNVFVKARDEYEAAEIAFRALNLLRAAWNLQENLPVYSTWSSPTPKPVNSIRLGPFQTVHRTTGKCEIRSFWYQQPFVSGDYPGPGWKVTPERLAEVRSTEQWIRRRLRKSSYRQFIEGNLINYVCAMDDVDPTRVFPQLWTVAESLTGCGRDGHTNYDKLVRRAANAFSRPHCKELILTHLRTARNQMVHELCVNIEDTSMFQLMRSVHGLLQFHLRSCVFFRTLDEVFEYLDLPRDPATLRRSVQLHRAALKSIAGRTAVGKTKATR